MDMKNIYNQNVIQLYKVAMLEIKKHIAVYGSNMLKEAVINKDSIDLLKRVFSVLPKMYNNFLTFLEKQENANAINQLDYMIKELENVRAEVKEIRDTIKSHNNDVGITANDLASIQKLDGLVAEQLEDLKDHKTILEGE